MQCRRNQLLVRNFLVRTMAFSAAAALTLNPALTPVVASDYRAAAPVAADAQMNARFLALGIGKSVVIDLPRDIKDVLVADPKIANAVVRSAQRAYIIGAAVGQTNIVFFDSAGQQIAAYDIAVKRDLNGVRAALKQTLPNADIQIEGVGDGVILSGTVANPITFTSINDNTVGGATGTGNPAPGDWSGIGAAGAGNLDLEVDRADPRCQPPQGGAHQGARSAAANAARAQRAEPGGG